MTKEQLSAGLKAICNRQKTDSIETAMRGLCTSLLHRCGEAHAPIGLKKLLDLLGVKFSWSNDYTSRNRSERSEALLDTSGGSLLISLKSDLKQNWRRDRFSIAHELAHAMILKTLRSPALIESLDDTDVHLDQLERVCNIGAAEILMPVTMIRRSIRENTVMGHGLLSMYDEYLVSRDALIWRLASILPATSVFRWRYHARNPKEETCYRVVACYPSYERNGMRPWLPRGTSVKHVSPDIFSTAEKRDSNLEFSITLNKKSTECEGILTSFPKRAEANDRPLFEGMEISDDSHSNDLILFARNKSVARSLWFCNKKTD